MSNLRQLGVGILAALVSVAILLGSIFLAIMESAPRTAQAPGTTLTFVADVSEGGAASSTPASFVTAPPVTIVFTNTPTPTVIDSPTSVFTPETTATPTVTSSPTLESSSTPTGSPTSTGATSPTQVCHPPSDWIQISVRSSDSLDSLANKYDTTAASIQQANCLPSDDLSNVKKLYVPQVIPTATTCAPYRPAGWVSYTIRSGDTLYSIAKSTGATLQQLLNPNCLHTDSIIRVGQQIWVPRLPSTATAVPSKTPKPPTKTPRPTTPPSDTPVPPPSDTPVPPPSDTPVPPPSKTPLPTEPPPGETPSL